MNPFPLVRADLKAMRGTAWLTVVLIALAVAIGVAVAAQERALRQASARTASDFPLLVGAPGSPVQLVLTGVYLQPEALTLLDGHLLQRLSDDPRVAALAPIAFGDVARGYPVIGTTADFVTRWGRITPSEGRLFGAISEAVVGADVALNLGDRLTPSHAVAGHKHALGEIDDEERAHQHKEHTYTVIGRLPRTGSPWDRAILVPVEAVWDTHGLGTGHREAGRIGPPFDAAAVPGVPAVVVKPKQVFQAYQLRAEMRQNGLMALFPAEVLVSLYASLSEVRDALVLASVLNNGLVFLAVAMLLVTLSSLRRQRYALLRALGASRLYVALVVWLGAAVLLVAGSLGGLLFGYLGAQSVSWIMGARTGLALSATIGPDEAMIAVLMAALGSLVALIPAFLASRRPVHELLRGP